MMKEREGDRREEQEREEKEMKQRLIQYLPVQAISCAIQHAPTLPPPTHSTILHKSS
jgi:hypothetical protein